MAALRGTPVLHTLTSHAREAAETVYAARLRPPADAGRLARFAYGLGLPLGVAGAVLRDPAARRRYLRICATQAAVVLGAGLLLAVSLHDVAWSSGYVHSTARGALRLELSADEILASLYGALYAFEWVVLALSYEHHDAISRDAALLTGAPPEDPPLTPRVRVDPRWITKRVRRYLRGWIVFAAGLPALFLLTFLPIVGRYLYAVATSLWATYWLAVLVTAKSAEAWREEHTAGPPWFLRRWEHLTARIPGFRWWLPRLYGRVWRRSTTQVFSPAARFERSPWELAGLALARVLGGIPGFYFFVRPFMPVAAAHVLVAQNAGERAEAAPTPAAPAHAGPAAPRAAA